MKHSNTILPVAVAMIICTLLPAKAQHCYRGRPLPKCKTFWITEFGYGLRLDRDYNAPGSYFTSEIGLMKNVNRQKAIGATLFFGADNNGYRYGLKPRYRRWLNNATSLDFGAGVLLGGEHDFINRYPGLTSHVGLNFGDWLALTGHLEITRFEHRQLNLKKTNFAWYIGAKLGSYPGLIVSVAAPIVYLILRAALQDVGLGGVSWGY